MSVEGRTEASANVSLRESNRNDGFPATNPKGRLAHVDSNAPVRRLPSCQALGPNARRLRIGAAMMLRPLQDARTLGFRAHVHRALGMAVAAYRRLAFEQRCRFVQNLRAPPSSGEGALA